jgi:TfoX/Sxy family transcriptional regulator of competence genes
MAYDEGQAQRIREHVQGEPGITEKRMFGGLAFLVDGHMAVAASEGGLLLRIDPAEMGTLSSRPGVRPFEMRGRPMSGWLHVGDEAIVEEEELRHWVDIGITYARSLPPK